MAVTILTKGATPHQQHRLMCLQDINLKNMLADVKKEFRGRSFDELKRELTVQQRSFGDPAGTFYVGKEIGPPSGPTLAQFMQKVEGDPSKFVILLEGDMPRLHHL